MVFNVWNEKLYYTDGETCNLPEQAYYYYYCYFYLYFY